MILSSLWIAYVTYFVGTVSLGPANLAIISHSLRYGLRGGIATAFGVVTGSMIWGFASALGFSALLKKWPDLLHTLGLLGGCYLIWLAWQAFLTALKNNRPEIERDTAASPPYYRKLFFYGVGLHLTNPKAMFVWMSIISLGMPLNIEGLLIPFLIVAGCGLVGMIVFCTYAVVFSIPMVMRAYIHATKPINLVIAVLFSVAGGALLFRSAAYFLA